MSAIGNLIDQTLCIVLNIFVVLKFILNFILSVKRICNFVYIKNVNILKYSYTTDWHKFYSMFYWFFFHYYHFNNNNNIKIIV